jgi:hypothetical protein
MKDLGFNEFGELADGGADEENLNKRTTEMTTVSSGSGAGVGQAVEDPDGDEEAENTEIAI